MIKKVFTVSGMHCTSCAAMIESDLEDQGINARCNYAQSTLEVECDEAQSIDDRVQHIVNESGYTISPALPN